MFLVLHQAAVAPRLFHQRKHVEIGGLQPFISTRKKGMKIGLVVSLSIVEAQEVQLSAGNNPDFGAQFTLKLLLAKNARPTFDEKTRAIFAAALVYKEYVIYRALMDC
jgi:hypothetical protein